jgi:C1A family cysteine protease
MAKAKSRRGHAAARSANTKKLHRHKIKRFGWTPDLPDARDIMYAVPVAVRRLPRKVDLRKQCPAIYDQGDLGSCTANAIAAAIEFNRMAQKLSTPNATPSRLFIYYNERVIENTVREDSGAQIRDGIKSVAKVGACFEGRARNEWPYAVTRFTAAPPKACYQAALKNRAVSYHRLAQTLRQMKGCLASGFPFVFGFTCYESFEGDTVANTGHLPMPKKKETVIGGHAVLCVGYDEAKKRFLIRNSWGTEWGMKGYYTMPYDYLLNNNLSDDFWTIRIVSQ